MSIVYEPGVVPSSSGVCLSTKRYFAPFDRSRHGWCFQNTEIRAVAVVLCYLQSMGSRFWNMLYVRFVGLCRGRRVHRGKGRETRPTLCD